MISQRANLNYLLILLLIIYAFLINWISANIGILPIDTFAFFDSGFNILNDKLLLRLFCNQEQLINQQNEAVGLGTNIYFEADQTIYLKSGDSMGQSSMLCYNREANWGILFFINQNNSKMRNEMLNTIFEHVLK